MIYPTAGRYSTGSDAALLHNKPLAARANGRAVLFTGPQQEIIAKPQPFRHNAIRLVVERGSYILFYIFWSLFDLLFNFLYEFCVTRPKSWGPASTTYLVSRFTGRETTYMMVFTGHFFFNQLKTLNAPFSSFRGSGWIRRGTFYLRLFWLQGLLPLAERLSPDLPLPPRRMKRTWLVLIFLALPLSVLDRRER